MNNSTHRVSPGEHRPLIDPESLREARNSLLRRIEGTAPGLLEQFPIPQYIELVESERIRGRPHSVPKAAYVWCSRVEASSTPGTLEDYNRLALLSLMLEFEARASPKRFPPSIRHQFAIIFERMLNHIRSPIEGFHRLGNGLFRVDLGVARVRLYPCGIEFADEYAGIPRRTLFSGGIRQSLRLAHLVLFRTRGFAPFYETHLDRRAAAKFSPEEYDRCYLRVADLLEANAGVKGMISSSWWNDPRLDDISPELRFLRADPEAWGALNLRVGTDETGIADALKLSPLRRRLYGAGGYVPTRYMLVWPRQDLLRWAREHRPRYEGDGAQLTR